jgi:putative ABC transport system permease protein
MGLLAFVVGVFLTYNALAFSYTDRLTLIRRLKLAGVTRAELARALLLELLLFCVIGTLLGAWLGALLASWLLPGVGRTLAQLYDVYISYPDTLLAPGVIWPALMTLLAALLCAVYPMRQALDTPVLQRPGSLWRIREVSRRDRLMALAGLSLLGLSGLGTIVAESLLPALAAMACLLLGAALLLPAVLRGLLSLLGRWVPGRNARLSWLLADTRWLLGPASLALMAMTLALVANSGLNTMIGSFRDATDRWLDQRLAADLYLRGGSERPELSAWLSEEAPELYVAVRRSLSQSRPNAGGKPGAVEIVALPAHPRYRDAVTLLRDEPDAQKRFQEGAGLFVSERAWRIDGWDAGSRLAICDALDPLPVLGIYHDYGNPRSQWMVDESLFTRCWPGHQPSGFSVLGPEGTDWNRTRARLSERFDLRDGEIIDQGTLKKAGMAVFDRTFAVSRALNALTLLVAGIGIFCAISAIHHHRLGQQALLCSLGMTRRERGALLLLQWGLLAVLSLALVWPFGTVLAGYLGAVVTPAAFGWSFPLQLEWRHFLVVALLATGSMTLAVLLPSLKLLRTSAATLLREQGT